MKMLLFAGVVVYYMLLLFAVVVITLKMLLFAVIVIVIVITLIIGILEDQSSWDGSLSFF